MQDIHWIGGGTGVRLFGGGDRRFRPHPHHRQQAAALKCPRCDSTSTKFCYYNNYNLSQPRYYCKACRRYWTSGGILRNVPVGGGCRKTNRSKPKPKPSPSSDDAAPPRDRRSSKSHSSSESSTAVAPESAAVATASAAAEVMSAISSESAPNHLEFPESNVDFDALLIDRSPEIGSFANLMTSADDPPSFLGFSVTDDSSFRLQQDKYGEAVENQSSDQKPGEMRPPQVDVSRNYGGLAALDWEANGGDQIQGMFDLTGTVDQAYWSQTQWAHNDHQSLYLP